MKRVTAILSLLSISLTVFAAQETTGKTVVLCKQDRYASKGELKRTLRIEEFLDGNDNKIKLHAVTEGFSPFVLDNYKLVIQKSNTGYFTAGAVSSGEQFSLELNFSMGQSALHIIAPDGKVTNEIMTCRVGALASYFPPAVAPILPNNIDLNDAYVLDPEKASFVAVDKLGPVNEMQFIVNGDTLFSANLGEMGPLSRVVNSQNTKIAKARNNRNLIIFFMKGPRQGQVMETRFPIGTDAATVLKAEQPFIQ